MCESLNSILTGLDYRSELMWTFAEVERWRGSQLERCLGTGLFVPAEPSPRIACSECGQIVDVLIVTTHSGQTEARLLCGDCHSPRAPLHFVSRWRLAYSQFLKQLLAALGMASTGHELVRGRVWQLGKWHCGGASRNVYLARSFQLRDTREVIEQARFPAGCVVFVPTQLPRPELRIEPLPTLIRLIDVLSWEEQGFALDKAHIEDQLRAAVATQSDRETPTVSKRGSRLSVIEGLKHELIEHLRAARDYALETRRRSGTPQLLPRPTREHLAKLLGVHRTTVTRCLEDGSAPELLSLWNLSADVDRILAHST